MDDYTKQITSTYLQVPVSDKTVMGEISGDFTLPDYQPEIKRLLRISASVLPPSKYIGDNESEFAGSIDYYVHYTASDNEVYCAPISAEYKIGVPTDKDQDLVLANMTGYASIVPDMISGRVISPRKLNIKCRLKTRAQIFGDMPLDSTFDSSVENGNELLRKKTSVTRVLYGAGELLRVSDEMLTDSRDGETRIISADGKVLVSESTCSADTVTCRGEVYLKLLTCRESDGETRTVMRKIPFSQSVRVDGVNGNYQANVKGTVSEMNINVDENRINVDVGILIDTIARGGEEINYVKDIYSTTHACECAYKTLSVPRASHAINSNFTFSDSVAMSDIGISSDYSIADVGGAVSVDDVELEDGKCCIVGKARFSLLLKKDGEYSSCDVDMPVRYITDSGLRGGTGDLNALIEPEIISARARLDGERLGIDAEIGICGTVWGNGSLSLLDGVSFGDEVARSRGECVICYPSREDSVWSVAKRYAVPVSSVIKANQLSADVAPDSSRSVEGVKYLII